MHDHDQCFKELIREFFGDFLQLFFADWAARLDTDKVEWLDKEVFPDPPDGARRVLDLVAKLPTREAVPGQHPGEPQQWLALVHIEIESPDTATLVRWRMHRSYTSLRERHGMPVLPIALFLKVGLNGIGVDVYEEHFWELRPIRFEFLYVGLPALDALQYVNGDNWLGVALAALMRIPPDEVANLGALALAKLVEAPLREQQRFLLGECVQAYLPLDEVQRRKYDELLSSGQFGGVQAMNTTWYEKGWIKGEEVGVQQGVQLGVLQTLQAMLEDDFGPLPQNALQRLHTMNQDELMELRKKIRKAESLRELGLVD
jgi:hypothetical protein